MGNINRCLKCLFNAILGCALIYGAVKITAFSTQGLTLGWSWVFTIGVLGISCRGICAGCSEKELALKILAGFMGIVMIIMLIFGIIVVVTRNKIRDNFDQASAEVAKPIMENWGPRELLHRLQQSGHCCGVVSAADWGDRIADSCECLEPGYGELSGSGCKSKPQGARGPDQIYSQTCNEVIYLWINFFFQIIMAFFFGFAVTALLGLLVSILMIYQVRRHDGSGGSSIAMNGY